ncbi:hypothetical protein D3C81_1235500 [compost metagenome]
MARGYHHPAVGVERTGREVDLFGATQTNIDDIRTCITQTARHRVSKHWAFKPHIASQYNTFALQLGHHRATDSIGYILIEIQRDLTTNIVGFETLGFYRAMHTALLLGMWKRGNRCCFLLAR